MSTELITIGFKGAERYSPVYFSKQLAKIKPGSTLEIPLGLATGDNSAVFRNELLKLFSIKTIELLQSNKKSKTNISSIIITLSDKPSEINAYSVCFKYTPDNTVESMEFTAIVEPSLLTESLLPQYFHPARLAALKRVHAMGDIVRLDSIFDISFGQNVAATSSRAKEAPTVRGRYILSSHISKGMFLDDSFSNNVTDISLTRAQQSIKANDIIISASGGINSSTSFAMVIAPEPVNSFHTNAIIKLTPRDGVDPKFSSLFFSLWATESYRSLYCYTPSVIKLIQISQLCKIPIPTNIDLLNRSYDLVNRLCKAEAETKQVFAGFDSLLS